MREAPLPSAAARRQWVCASRASPIATLRSRVAELEDDRYMAPDLAAAYIEDLWVEESHRHRGVARALIAAVEDWARGQQIGWLGSDTEPGNRDSRAFHKALGFDEIEQLVVFGKPLD